jgi:hypothetical protein
MRDEKSKPVPTPGMVFSNVIFEQTDNGAFLVFDRVERKFQVANDPWHSYYHDEIEYIPLRRLPWPTAHLPKEESEEKLFNEIRDFFVSHLDISNELFYDVYACFVLASWRSEDFTVVPYLFFLGPLASGKTRALECFHRLCYRSIMSTSMSPASLFRALEAWKPTLLLDETEIYNREAMVEVLALLNSGYRKGQYAIRIEKIERHNPKIATFDTFGFKVLAGTEELAATLQSRCIITTMSKAVRRVNLFVEEEKAQELRNKLLMYRFRNLGKIPDDFDPSKLNACFENARVIELFVSLLQVAPTEEIKQGLLKCMQQIAQSRLDEEQASIEARVFDAILKCESKVENGRLSTQSIAEAFNEGLTEKDQITSRFIGRRVAALGFEKCKLPHGGLAGFFWDTRLVERLKTRYYPTSSSLTPLTPLSPSSKENNISNQRSAGECGENGESRVGLEPKLSIQGVLERLRAVFAEGTEEEWVKHAVKNGLSENEACSLFESLKGSELFWFQRNGQTFWRWA